MPEHRRNVEMIFRELHCIEEKDPGKAEPYLWSVFLKIDGETIGLNPDNPLQLQGTPEYKFGAGSHRNITEDRLADGETVDIPYAVGGFDREVAPLELNVLGTTFLVPGIVVGIAVLMEEDLVSDSGAEAGHRAFNDLVENSINAFLTTLSLSDVYIEANTLAGEDSSLTLEDALLQVLQGRFETLREELVENSQSVVKEAIKNEQNWLVNIFSWINGDDFLGSGMLVHTTKSILDNDGRIDFSIDFNESDRGEEYQIHGSTAIGEPIVRRIPIQVDVVPSPRRLEIKRVARRYSRSLGLEHITYVGGDVDGDPWIITRRTATLLLDHNIKEFFVRAPDGSETPVIAGDHEITGTRYIRSSPNVYEEDNLLSLPELDFFIEEE